MKYFLDTEFIERPCTIDLLSVGIVAQDGREYYAVNAFAMRDRASPWVRDNVLPHLGGPEIPHEQIAAEVRAFVGDDPASEFWGYYADYDWVVFCWLFGSMMDLPQGWPMYCRDLKQWCDQLGNPQLPEQNSTEHNALHDARWNKKVYDFLRARSVSPASATTPQEKE